MNLTPEQATDMFMHMTKRVTDIDPASIDRAAILAHFTEIFAR